MCSMCAQRVTTANACNRCIHVQARIKQAPHVQHVQQDSQSDIWMPACPTVSGINTPDQSTQWMAACPTISGIDTPTSPLPLTPYTPRGQLSLRPTLTSPSLSPILPPPNPHTPFYMNDSYILNNYNNFATPLIHLNDTYMIHPS